MKINVYPETSRKINTGTKIQGCYAQLHSIKFECSSIQGQILLAAFRRFAMVRNWQWSRLKVRLTSFRRSTIPQKQFILLSFNIQSFVPPLSKISTKSKHILHVFTWICSLISQNKFYMIVRAFINLSFVLMKYRICLIIYAETSKTCLTANRKNNFETAS